MTASIPGWGTNTINAMAIDSTSRIIYMFGGTSGVKFGKYAIIGGIFTDLSSKITGYLGQLGKSIAINSTDVYLGGDSAKFGVYNISGDSYANLNSKLSGVITDHVLALSIDSNNVYLGDNSGNFAKCVIGTCTNSSDGTGVVNLTSRISSFWGITPIRSFVANSTDLFFSGGTGGGSTKFAKCPLSTCVANTGNGIDLSSRVSFAWGVSSTIFSLAMDTSDIYMVGYWARLARCPLSACGNDTANVTDLTSKVPAGFSHLKTIIFAGSNNLSFGGDSGKFAKYTAFSYASLGTYESSTIDLTYPSNFSTLAWTAIVPAQTGANAFRVQMAIDAEGDGPWNYVGTDGTASTYFTTSGTSIPSSLNGYRYVRYKLYLQTADMAYTSSLDDITINYYNYSTSQTLTSSPYNSTDTANVIGALAWTENTSLPTGTGVTVSLRTATSTAALSSASWNDFTNATANCSKTTGTVSCPLAAIPAGLKDGTGDQWFQYKATLTSTGANTPTFSDLTIQYVVNAPPQFDTSFNTTGTIATQNSDGTVTIQYQIRDPDATTGTVTPNAITPSFEYSINGGSAYSAITSTYLASTDLQNKTVGESSYTLYSASWSPKAQLGSSIYVTNAKIRVTLNDNEAANNTANAVTANFILDTTNPVPGSPSLSVNPNSAAPSTATLTLSATDNSSLQMKVGLASDLSDASWETYNTSKTITLATDPDTVYIQFKDAYGNTSSIVSGTTPETPTAMMIQDTSNLKLTPAEYRLFAAWKVVATPNPGFKQYNVFRSTDNTTFTQITTITNINTNYYGDSTVVFNQTYYYKVSSQDQNNNISFYSSTIQAKADGIQNLGEGGGGTDGLPPTISNVTSSNIQTTQATITWTTDELSNSTVDYSTDISFSTEQGVTSYVTSHSVTLISLTPNTAYKFQVKSVDPSGNQATNNNAGAGYTFTTSAGPKITNVDAEDISNTTAKIVWFTDKDSNSYVVYSTNSNLTSSTQIGTPTLVGGTGPNYYHSVTLTSLASGITYYYYVQSTDSQNNIAINNNGLNYYTFKTTQDTTSPTISSITVSTTTPDTAVITWTTNEPSTSQIEYGKTTSFGDATSENSDLVITHIVSITNLTPNTTYNFRVKSKDSSGNETVSANQTFTTLEESKIKVDQIAPTISNIAAGSITSSSATITFTSNESCLGVINYGKSTSYLELRNSWNPSFHGGIIIIDN